MELRIHGTARVALVEGALDSPRPPRARDSFRARVRSAGELQLSLVQPPTLRLPLGALRREGSVRARSADATYFVGRRLGSAAEAAFLRGLAGLDIEGPAPEDFERMAELVDRYADFPLGGTDASVVALAERIGAPTLITLDSRHFAAVRPRHREAFELLP